MCTECTLYCALIFAFTAKIRALEISRTMEDLDLKIFETHAHYDDEAFSQDRDELLEGMLSPEGALDYIINVGASLEGCKKSLEFAYRYERVYAAVGIHPEEVDSLTRQDIDWIVKQASDNKKIVAIGEIGLDYHYPEPEKEVQKNWFRQQLQAAREVKKPVIIHSREACADTLECMKRERADETGGVIHCYSYTKEAAEQFLDMGFFIGVGGVVTFKNARKLVETVEAVPLSRILLETDSPYMAPEPHRGTRNDSRNIAFVAEKIAQIKGVSAQEVIDTANENARKLFFGK